MRNVRACVPAVGLACAFVVLTWACSIASAVGGGSLVSGTLPWAVGLGSRLACMASLTSMIL